MSEAAEPGERGERIAKWLARAGVASRRDAEKLVAEGRVKLNNIAVVHPPPSSPGRSCRGERPLVTSPTARDCGAITSQPAS